MLSSAFDGDIHSVSIDVLSPSDLDSMRQSFNAGRKSVSPKSSTTASKRYLILSYQGEFDQVHYPLALNFCEVDDVAELKRTIIRLRDEIDHMKRSSSQVDPISFHELESALSKLQRERDILSRDMNEFSIENTKLRELVDSLKLENHTMRSKLDRVDSSRRRPPSPHKRAPPQPPRQVTTSRSPRQVVTSRSPVRPPAVRIPSPTSSSFGAPRQSQRMNMSYSRLSPVSSTRSIDRTPPRKPSTALSEVDARLQALQNFLRNQKRNN
jgi:hypothetical protein